MLPATLGGEDASITRCDSEANERGCRSEEDAADDAFATDSEAEEDAERNEDIETVADGVDGADDAFATVSEAEEDAERIESDGIEVSEGL